MSLGPSKHSFPEGQHSIALVIISPKLYLSTTGIRCEPTMTVEFFNCVLTESIIYRLFFSSFINIFAQMVFHEERFQGWSINEQHSEMFFTLIEFSVLMKPLNDVQQIELVSL